MADVLKRKQVRINLSPESEKYLQRLAESIGSLSETAIATALVDAGLKACADHGNRMPLPLKFNIVDAPAPSRYQLNEPVEPKHRK